MFEYFSSHAWLFWLLVSIVCLILEVSSGTFYILCFAIGALGGVVSSGLGGAFWVQVVVFALFSTLSIFCIRPLALTYLHRGEDARESNADALIGRIGTVIEPIDATQSGYIKVEGGEWRLFQGRKSENRQSRQYRHDGDRRLLNALDLA